MPPSSIRSRCISTRRPPSASMLKGLSGSGWHLCSIMMRMMFDGFIGRTASLGSPGVNELRWLAPLRPGDDLTLDVEVAEARVSRSRPETGIVTFKGMVRNAAGAGAVRDGLADHRARGAPTRRAEQADAFLRGHRDRRSGASSARSPSPPRRSRNSPRNSIRSAFISTRRRAANRCSAGWPPRAGMSARSA